MAKIDWKDVYLDRIKQINIDIHKNLELKKFSIVANLKKEKKNLEIRIEEIKNLEIKEE